MLGVRVEIKNAAVKSVTELPLGFSVTITNSSSWGNDPDNRTLIDGDVQIGILSAQEIHELRFRLVKGGSEFGPFTIGGLVRTYDCPDIENPMDVKLTAENFEVVK